MATTEKKGPLDVVIDGVTGIFLPFINLLSAAGIMSGVLAILSATGLVPTGSENYLVLNAMSQSLFYFLPMLLAYTAAKKFGANPYTAVVIAGVTLYPALNGVVEGLAKDPTATTSVALHFLGLPVTAATYSSSVIPIICAVGLLVFVERLLDSVLPELVRGFLTPLVCIVVVSAVTLYVFGPFGKIVGDVLARTYGAVYAFSPLVAGAVLGALIQPMVIFGFHWAFIIIAMTNVITNGVPDTILALMAPPVFAQAGACLAVMLKSRSAKTKGICASAALSAFFGITEPAMFGVNLPRKLPLVGVIAGGAVGGAITGAFGAKAYSFAFPSLAALPVFYGDGSAFVPFLLACAVGLFVSFALTMVMRFEADLPGQTDTRA